MKVLILGGYGNFGKRIARLLTRKGVAVIVAGRDGAKAAALAKVLPPKLADMAVFDAKSDLLRSARDIKAACRHQHLRAVPERRLRHSPGLHRGRRALHRSCRWARFRHRHYATGCRRQRAKCRRDKRRQHRAGAVRRRDRALPAAIFRDRLADIRYRARPKGGARARHHAGHPELRRQEAKTLRRI